MLNKIVNLLIIINLTLLFIISILFNKVNYYQFDCILFYIEVYKLYLHKYSNSYLFIDINVISYSNYNNNFSTLLHNII